MSFPTTLHPILTRFLAASAGCLVLDAALLEAMAQAGLQVHLARAVSLGLATCVLFLARRLYVMPGKPLETAKGQPVPLGVLMIAGMVLNYTIFAKLLPLMPVPLDAAGRLLALAAGGALSAGCNIVLIHGLLPTGKAEKLLAPRTVARGLICALFVLLAMGSMEIVAQLRELQAFPVLKGPLGPHNGPDPWMRLVQVRDWISGSDFFDHAVKKTNAPEGGVTSHWTRPMDILVAGMYKLTPHGLSMDVRLMLAAAWLPALLVFGILFMLCKAAGRHFMHAQVIGSIAVLMLMNAYKYTSPGDVDHHALLIFLWCGVMAMLLSKRIDIWRALVMGLMLGTMVWISLEALVVCAAIYAILGFEAIFAPEKARAFFVTALGAALAATGGLYVEIPAAEALTRLVYDSLSIVQVALLWQVAAGAGVMWAAFKIKMPGAARFLVAAIAGSGVLLAQYSFCPKFFLGPLVDVDPFILTGFLPRVIEAQSLTGAGTSVILRLAMPPVLAGFLLGVCLTAKKIRPDKRRFLLILAVLLAWAAALTVWQVRWGYYLHAVSMVAIGALMPGMAMAARGDTGAWLKDVPRYMRAYVPIVCSFLLMLVLIGEGKPASARDYCKVQTEYAVHTQQLQKLMGDKSLIVYAYQDLGAEIQFFTPYRIIASNYHREGKGMKDISAIEKAKTPEEARKVLTTRQVDALFVCPGFYEEDSWLSRLAKDSLPKWLTPVNGLEFMKTTGDKPLLLRVKK